MGESQPEKNFVISWISLLCISLISHPSLRIPPLTSL
jgi:hypothetical protein